VYQQYTDTWKNKERRFSEDYWKI